MNHTALRIPLLIILMTLSSSLKSQNEGIFAFAYNSDGRVANEEKIPAYKISTTQLVLNDLILAKGVRNMPRPKLTMSNAQQRPAWTKPSTGEIHLEELAYDICSKYGKDSLNAIAALLAHELIHYYEEHDWEDHYLNQHKSMGFADIEGAGYQQEFKADHKGGLLAHMAGYKTLGLLPSLLSNIYSSYHLEESSNEGYPSLTERRNIAIKSDVEITKNSRLFDMSLYLIASGEYEKAKEYLSYLTLKTKFQSREIYNNIGLINLLMALDYFSTEEMPYALPLELVTASRISFRNTQTEARNELLDDALFNLKNAITLDPNFAAGYANLSAAYILKKDWFEAEYHANKAKQLYESSEIREKTNNATTLLGIIAALKDNKEKARALFIASNTAIGRTNLCILNAGESCAQASDSKRNDPVFTVDDVQLDQLFTRIMQNKEQANLSIELNPFESFHTIAKETSEIVIHLDHANMGTYLFYQIIRDNEDASDKVNLIGKSNTEVNELFKAVPKVLQTDQGTISDYKSIGLITKSDKNNFITEWCVYKLNTQ